MTGAGKGGCFFNDWLFFKWVIQGTPKIKLIRAPVETQRFLLSFFL
jgi:hypothetical protein